MNQETTMVEFENLYAMPVAQLAAMGLRMRETANGKTLWLFPKVWYGRIPAGFAIVDINWKEKPFVPGKTAANSRGGLLAFGIVRSASAA